MARFCSTCGSSTEPTERFCKSCGTPIEEAAPPPPPGAGAVPPVQPVPPPSYPPPPGATQDGPSAPFGFEAGICAKGREFAKSMGLTQPGLLEKMVRGAFLDTEVYRAAAADANDTPNAIIALIIPAVAGMLGTMFVLSHLFFARAVTFQVVSAAVGVATLLVALAVMSAASQAVVGRKVGFGELLRGLAYAQSPGVAAIIPVIGWIVALWRIMTSLVAMREITGGNMGKAVMLLLVGIGTSIVMGLILSPILIGALGVSALTGY